MDVLFVPGTAVLSSSVHLVRGNKVDEMALEFDFLLMVNC